MNILITGGAGSLGKAFCRYLYKQHNLIVIDHSEWGLAELQDEFPNIQCLLDDFANWRYETNPVDLVIHCGAFKHVNMGENNIEAFIENNINKTNRLFKEAYKYNADIMFISTDKAVEPISLYGFTKAIGEKLCKTYNGTVVRLGNILNSSGSVIPIWEKAIAENKPLKITDFKMTRYVIKEDDAVKQIWKSYLKGKKLIIPKMDEVLLFDLMQEVLSLHNTSIDYPIEIIGKRAGEKIKEKLKWEGEV